MNMDFLRPEPMVPRAGWVLLAGGAAVLALALLWQQHSDEVATAARQAQQARRAAAQAPAAPPPAPGPAERRWQQVQPELRRPWQAALQAIDGATRPPVVLLSLQIDPESGLIGLDADAATYADALAYVERLSAAPPLQPARLVAHDTLTDPAGGARRLRFSVTTTWRTP
ncbi:hypothetical protein HLB44_17950 [Aquincola sp. S2]|uniref:PilN domain-containing protein n=1 Tax=Pseudaquabacterium terrae TaxID=2732868 RepID=A0ABX2EJN6_9BURK|nr:hypothetical protein [Aquabacterium terrae]NRF68880.1 hypothetical protein [Aquabacterium terrae]